MLWLWAFTTRIALVSGRSGLMTLEEMAETKEEERVMPACAICTSKAPKELMEASVQQVKR